MVLPSRATLALSRGLAKIFEDVASFFAVVVEGRLREEYPERHVDKKADNGRGQQDAEQA